MQDFDQFGILEGHGSSPGEAAVCRKVNVFVDGKEEKYVVRINFLEGWIDVLAKDKHGKTMTLYNLPIDLPVPGHWEALQSWMDENGLIEYIDGVLVRRIYGSIKVNIEVDTAQKEG